MRTSPEAEGLAVRKLELSAEEIGFSIAVAEAEAALSSARSGAAGCGDESVARAEGEAGSSWLSMLIGQPRALEALKMGIRIRAKGYNVHVSGAPGTGRRSAVLRLLSEEPAAPERLRDIAFVYNFASPTEPTALGFIAGGAKAFKSDLHRLVEALKRIVRLQAESPAAKAAIAEATASVEEKENSILAAFEAELAVDGFRAVQVESEGAAAMDIVPLRRAVGTDPEAAERGLAAAPGSAPIATGTPHVQATERNLAEPNGSVPNEPIGSFEELQALVASGELEGEAYDRLRERWYGHMDRMKRIFAELRTGRMELEGRLAELRDTALAPQVAAELAYLVERWPGRKVHAWLAALEKDILGHLYLFYPGEEGETQRKRRHPGLSRYGVNILIDREGRDRPPVIVENHPTASNLFGSVESKPDEEVDARSAYLRIRSGSYLKASGGFLVLRAEDLLADEEAWHRVKRSLQDGRVEIQSREGPFGQGAWLKPEAIKADVKVIMIGGESSYDVLYQADPDFQKLFKIHAEFDSTMRLCPDSLRDYAAFALRVCREESLLPLSPEGLAAVIEQGARIAEYRERLTTRFGMVADLLREADYRARLGRGPAGSPAGGPEAGPEGSPKAGPEGSPSEIGAAAVRAAVEARARLANLPEEKLGQMIASGEIILQASGQAVGRVNGLAVHDRGYYAFGMPAVISAQVSPGEGGVINIEGESGLSGEIYDKAVLIVEGFLRSRYARDFPLAVTASICFEQSYTAVEGDSASSTAVYALLSAIADIPLRQDVAVTGSLNQIGQVQPVGGVNEKIEGFYRVCGMAGLTGTQGVMIPRRNVVNLTLSKEVQEAIAAGTFHVWAVSSIDEGIEVLTGMSAGKADARGDFPSDSFNAKVRRELLRMAKTVKAYM